MIQATIAYISAAVLIIGGMLYFAAWTSQHRPVAYDCRMASYPQAIDVPQAVIKKCKEQK